MDPPVRMVCGGCLRSVEIVLGSAGDRNRCPSCGGPIDSSIVEPKPGAVSQSRTGVTRPERDLSPVASALAGSNADWMQTWSRGTLGSLGRFQLRERLGDGGFGQVYLAYDPRLDRDVALKVLKRRDPSDRVMERFFREARAAARLDHPNIVAVHDAGFDAGRCWVAFHFVSGRSLLSYRDHHRLDPPTAARILRDLADAVDHAHLQGVLHRDLKPANVLIDDLGRPRLIDFGLSRRSDLESSLTHDGAVVGTPAYMSPEQALGFSSQVDERSDVFSLGVILFEMLGGQRPYGGDENGTRAESDSPPGIGRQKQASSPSVRSINPAVPTALDRICRCAIARNPQDRYQSARALADELDRWLLRHRSGGLRISQSVSTIVLGIAAALLLVIGIMIALVSWGSSTGRLVAMADNPPAARLDSPPGVVDFPLIGNVRKRVYHTAKCPTLAAMNHANRTPLADEEQAAALGLLPCKVCQPPGAASDLGDPDGP
jgi:hypothetical protein